MPELKRAAVKKQRKPKTEPKQSKQRSKRRGGGNMAIYYVMFALISVIVFSALSVTVLFNLGEIIIEGDSIYSDEEIIETAGIKLGVNLIRLDTEVFKRRLIDNYAYIDSVVIRKNLPFRLTINITGAVEMANIEHEGRYYIISKNGRILQQTDTTGSNTVIYGFDADDPDVGGYISSEDEHKKDLMFEIMGMMEYVGLAGIVSVDISQRLYITMNYMNRVELLIGPETDLEVKLKAAAEILENEIDINESGTLRLMDTQSIVFRRDVIEATLGPSVEDTAQDDDITDDGNSEE